MGYEVLDADGAASGVSSSPYPPADVVALDDLPPPAEAERPRAPRRRGSAAPHGWRTVGDRLRQLSRLAWVLVAASALVGVAAGAWWADRHGQQVRAAQARASVQAYATVMSVDPLVTGHGWVADFTVRVVNMGPLPVKVALSSGDERPRTDAPFVSMVSGPPEVAPAASGLAKIRVALDCTSDRAVSVTLPVASPDGTVRQVALHDSTGPDVGMSSRDLCSSVQGRQVLDVSLSGTLDRPSLVLRNNSERQLVVSLDSGSPLTQSSSQIVSLTTVPRLPVVVRANGSTTVRLVITASRCRQDLSELSSMGGYGYLAFQGEAPGVGMAEEASSGVDASPLVGAAMARACQRRVVD